MPYVPFYDPDGWEDDPSTDTPISADALNYIEAGIETAQAAAESAAGDITTDPAWAAKGDLIVATANDAASVQSAGANDEIIVYDSAQTRGVKTQKLKNAQVASDAAIARDKLATQTRRIPISLTNPIVSASAGNSFFNVAALTDWDAGRWEFVKDVGGKIYGYALVPQALAATGGNVVAVIAASATTGVTRLSMACKAVADGESLNPTLTDHTAQDITVPATSMLRKDVTFALTESLAAGDLLIVELYHEGAHANDSLAVNTLLFAAYLDVTVN